MSKALVLVGYMRRSADDHTHPAQQRYILLECVAAAAFVEVEVGAEVEDFIVNYRWCRIFRLFKFVVCIGSSVRCS